MKLAQTLLTTNSCFYNGFLFTLHSFQRRHYHLFLNGWGKGIKTEEKERLDIFRQQIVNDVRHSSIHRVRFEVGSFFLTDHTPLLETRYGWFANSYLPYLPDFFSTRILNALFEHHIYTLRELTTYKKNELLRLPQIGIKTVETIEAGLFNLGLKMAD